MTVPIFVHSQLDEADLTPSQFRVYGHIARRADNQTGEATCGIESMAEKCKLHPDTIRAALRALFARCMIRAKDRPGMARVYMLTPPEEWVNPLEDNGGVGKEGGASFPTTGKGGEGANPATPPSVSGGTPPKGMDTKVLPEGTPSKVISFPPQPPSDALPAAPAIPAASRPDGLGEKGDEAGEDEAAKAARRAEREAKTAVMLRLGKLYRRQLKTEWNDREKAALKKLWASDSFLDSIDEVEAYYLLPATAFPMNGRERKREDYRRHDLVTLLNNWWSELGKARKFFELNPQHRPGRTASVAGPVRLTSAFLEWIKVNYPKADLTLTPSMIVKNVGAEFRRAHPNTPLTGLASSTP